jgi:sec-independent protein translocase protein TatB
VNLTPNEVLIIAVVALIVLGPKRLPEAARAMGKAFREVRKMSTTVRAEIDAVVKEPMDEFKAALDPKAFDADAVVRDEARIAGAPDTAPDRLPNRGYRPADELPDELDEAPADSPQSDDEAAD